jgi:hypothetical protein
MKILKYIFFLILLATIGVFVFIATQKSDFVIKNSITVKVPKSIVFNYVNDYRNWESWSSWKEDDLTTKFNYPDLTAGTGASYSWENNSFEGNSKTTNLKNEAFIEQKSAFNGNDYVSKITLKDTIGGTKLEWINKGNIGVFTKFYATFSGGVKNYLTQIFDRNINNLKIVLNKEINNFYVKNSGIITIPSRYYVKSEVVCKPSEVQSKINSSLPKIAFFFKNNNLKMNGKPFVIKEFETVDSVKIGIYGPLREAIFLAEGSDLTTGFMEGFTALKTTLFGDYSHLALAKQKAMIEFNKQKLVPSSTLKPMEVYYKTVSENVKPSKWQTFIQLPVYVKPAFVPRVYVKRREVKPPTDEIPEAETPVKDLEKEEF